MAKVWADWYLGREKKKSKPPEFKREKVTRDQKKGKQALKKEFGVHIELSVEKDQRIPSWLLKKSEFIWWVKKNEGLLKFGGERKKEWHEKKGRIWITSLWFG